MNHNFPLPIMTERFRTTISIDPEVHAIFKRMADAGNMSTSRAMGEWLADTADAANMIVAKMEEAKKAPMRVMREMQAMVAGMSDQLELDIVKVRSSARHAAAPATLSVSKSAPAAPSSNTGLKSPNKGKGKGRNP